MKSIIHNFGKSVYDMELNEELEADVRIEKIFDGTQEITCDSVSVLRVPGGWIYYNRYLQSNGVFVPFDNEFMKKPKDILKDSYDCGH